MLRVTLLAVLICKTVAGAQTLPATTQPYHVPTPPGFVRFAEGSHTVIAEPADGNWIRRTLHALSPATRPTTMPSDLARNLETHRAAICSQMMTLLAIDDEAVVDQLLDQTLRPLINRYAKLDLPVVFLVTARPRLKQIVLAGWTDPHVRYNKADDEVEIARGVRLSLDGTKDENLIVVLLPDVTTKETSPAVLTRAVRALDEQVSVQIANRAEAEVQLAFIAFMAREGFDPLKLKPDQTWFSMGVCGVLSSYFSQQLDDIAADSFIAGLSTDRRDNPFRSAEIDLLHPTPINDIRPQSVPFYSDAYQRKAIGVVHRWVEQAGLDAPAKVIVAMRDSAAADGAALLKLIKNKLVPISPTVSNRGIDRPGVVIT